MGSGTSMLIAMFTNLLKIHFHKICTSTIYVETHIA